METKFKEIVIKTSDFEEMRGKFLAEKLTRGWSEEFVDEDTGDVVSLERKELILEKGTELKDTELSLINFHLQTDDIDHVVVSNQRRVGSRVARSATVWQVTASYNNKKYNLYLYSNSIAKTEQIATDYLEQLMEGLFSFVAIRELNYSTLIPENYGQEDSSNELLEDLSYYNIEVSIEEPDFERRETFIVKATDAEDAKETIIKWLLFKRAEGANTEQEELITTIISAKTIPCDYVVSYEFSSEYLNDES